VPPLCAEIPVVLVVNVLPPIREEAGGFPQLLIAVSATWWMLHAARSLPHVRTTSNITNIAFHVTIAWLAWCAVLGEFTSSSAHPYSNMPMLALLGAPVAWASGHMWGSATVASLVGSDVRQLQGGNAVAAWAYARLQAGVEALELLRAKRVQAAGHKSPNAAILPGADGSPHAAAGNLSLGKAHSLRVLAQSAHTQAAQPKQRRQSLLANTLLAGSKKRRRSILVGAGRAMKQPQQSGAALQSRRSLARASTHVASLVAHVGGLLTRGRMLLGGAALSLAGSTPEALMLQAAAHAHQVDLALHMLAGFVVTPDMSLHCALLLSSKFMRSGVTGALKHLSVCASSSNSSTYRISISERFLSLMRSHFDLFTLKAAHSSVHHTLGSSEDSGLLLGICSSLPTRSALESFIGHESYYFSAALRLHARQARLAQLRFLKAQYAAWKGVAADEVDLSAVHRTAMEMEAARIRAEVHFGALTRLKPEDARIQQRLEAFRSGGSPPQGSASDEALGGADGAMLLDAFTRAESSSHHMPAAICIALLDFVPCFMTIPGTGSERGGSSWAAVQLGADLQSGIMQHGYSTPTLKGVKVTALSRLLSLVPAAAGDSSLLQAVHEPRAQDDACTGDIMGVLDAHHTDVNDRPPYAALVVSGESGDVGRILRADDAACELLGRTRSDLEGTHVSTVLPAPYSSLSQAQLEGWLDDVDVWLGRWFMGAVVAGGGHLVPVRGALFETPPHLHTAANENSGSGRGGSSTVFKSVFSLLLQPLDLTDCLGVAVVRTSRSIQGQHGAIESAAAAVRRRSMAMRAPGSAAGPMPVARVGTVEVVHASAGVHVLLGTEASVGAGGGEDGLPVLSDWIPALGVRGGDVLVPGQSVTPIPHAAVAQAVQQHSGHHSASPDTRGREHNMLSPPPSMAAFPVFVHTEHSKSKQSVHRFRANRLAEEAIDPDLVQQAASAVRSQPLVGLACEQHLRLQDAEFIGPGGVQGGVCTLSMHSCVPLEVQSAEGVAGPSHVQVAVSTDAQDSDEWDAADHDDHQLPNEHVLDEHDRSAHRDDFMIVFFEACSLEVSSTGSAMQGSAAALAPSAAFDLAPSSFHQAQGSPSSDDKATGLVPLHTVLNFMQPLHLQPAARLNASLRGVLIAALFLIFLAYPVAILSVATVASIDYSIALEARRFRVLQQAQFVLGAATRAQSGYASFFNTTTGIEDLAGLRQQVSDIAQVVEEQADFRSAAFQVFSGYSLPTELSARSVAVLDTATSTPKALTSVESMEYLRSAMQEIAAEALQEGLPPRDIVSPDNLFSASQILWLNLQPRFENGLLQTSERFLQSMLDDEAAILLAIVVVAVLVAVAVVVARVCCVAPRVYSLVKQLDQVPFTVGRTLAEVPTAVSEQMRKKAMVALQTAADDDWSAGMAGGDDNLQVSQLRAHIQMLAVDDSRAASHERHHASEPSGAQAQQRSSDVHASLSRLHSSGRDRSASAVGSEYSNGAGWDMHTVFKKTASPWAAQCCACLPSAVLLTLFLLVLSLVRSSTTSSGQAAGNQLAVHYLAVAQAEYFDAVTDIVHLADWRSLANSEDAEANAQAGGFNLSAALPSHSETLLRAERAHANFFMGLDRVLFGGDLPDPAASTGLTPLGFGPGAPQARLLLPGFETFFQNDACQSISGGDSPGLGIKPLNLPLARSTPSTLPAVFKLLYPNCSTGGSGASLAGYAGAAQLFAVYGQTVVQALSALPPPNAPTAALLSNSSLKRALTDFAVLDSTVLRPASNALIQRADAEFAVLDAQFGQLCLFIAGLLPVAAAVLCCISLPRTDAFAAQALHSLTLVLLLEQASTHAKQLESSLSSPLSRGIMQAGSSGVGAQNGEHSLVTRLRRFYGKASTRSDHSFKLHFDLSGDDDAVGSGCCGCKCCFASCCMGLCGQPADDETSARCDGYDSGDSFSDDGAI